MSKFLTDWISGEKKHDFSSLLFSTLQYFSDHLQQCIHFKVLLYLPNTFIYIMLF